VDAGCEGRPRRAALAGALHEVGVLEDRIAARSTGSLLRGSAPAGSGAAVSSGIASTCSRQGASSAATPEMSRRRVPGASGGDRVVAEPRAERGPERSGSRRGRRRGRGAGSRSRSRPRWRCLRRRSQPSSRQSDARDSAKRAVRLDDETASVPSREWAKAAGSRAYPPSAQSSYRGRGRRSGDRGSSVAAARVTKRAWRTDAPADHMHLLPPCCSPHRRHRP
jgi:hypothetical protein